MAFGTKYKASFYDYFGADWNIEFQYDGYTGSETILTLAETPLIIKKGQDSKDKSTTLFPFSIQANFIVDLQTVGVIRDDFFVENNTVKIYIHSSQLNYVWYGWVAPEFCEFIFRESAYVFVVNGVDGFKIAEILDTDVYDLQNGRDSIIELDRFFFDNVCKALNIEYPINIRMQSSMKFGDKDWTLQDTRISAYSFDSEENVKEVIEKILQSFSLRCFVENNYINLQRFNDIVVQPSTYRNILFDSTSSQVSMEETEDLTKIIGAGEDLEIIQDFAFISINGGVKKINTNNNLKLLNLIKNAEWKNQNTSGAPYDWTMSGNATVKGNGIPDLPYYVELTGDGTTGGRIYCDVTLPILDAGISVPQFCYAYFFPFEIEIKGGKTEGSVLSWIMTSSVGTVPPGAVLQTGSPFYKYDAGQGKWLEATSLNDSVVNIIPDEGTSLSVSGTIPLPPSPTYLIGTTITGLPPVTIRLGIACNVDNGTKVMVHSMSLKERYQYISNFNTGINTDKKWIKKKEKDYFTSSLNKFFINSVSFETENFDNANVPSDIIWSSHENPGGLNIQHYAYYSSQRLDYMAQIAEMLLFSYAGEYMSVKLLGNNLQFNNLLKRKYDGKTYMQMQDIYDVKKATHEIKAIEIKDVVLGDVNFEATMRKDTFDRQQSMGAGLVW